MTFDPRLVAHVLTEQQMGGLLAAISTAAEVVIDLENTDLNEHLPHSRIAMAALTLPQRGRPDEEPTTWVVPGTHPQGPWPAPAVAHEIMRRVTSAIQQHRLPVVNHNVKYDLRWLAAHTGIDLSQQVVWDTMMSARLLDENESAKLKEAAPRTFGIPRWDDHDLSTPCAAERVPYFDLALYAARDTYWTWRLAEHHRRLMGIGPHREDMDTTDPDQVDLLRLGTLMQHHAMPTVRMLTRTEIRGIVMDRGWVVDNLAQFEATVTEQRAALDALDPELTAAHPDVEDRSYEPTANYFRDYIERAVEDDRIRVMATTAKGRPSWNKAVLIRARSQGNEIASHLLDYRRASKSAQFLRSWLEFVTPADTIHATYRAATARTGRLSCADPNLQQVSKTLRPAFLPRPGHLIVECDFSQIELRLAAMIANVQPVLDAYNEGADLHRRFAAQIAGKREGEVTDLERQRGKAGNFGFIFGMGADSFVTYAYSNYQVTLTDEESAEIREGFFDFWQGLPEWHATTIRKAASTGRVTSLTGRIRRLPTVADGDPHAERQAINFPIQSLASDLMMLAAARIDGTDGRPAAVPEARIVGTVHDSIVVEVPEHDWKPTVVELMRAMCGDLPGLLAPFRTHITVPIEAEATIGERWGDPHTTMLSSDYINPLPF